MKAKDLSKFQKECIKSISIADNKTFVDFLHIIRVEKEKLVHEHPEYGIIDKKITEKESN